MLVTYTGFKYSWIMHFLCTFVYWITYILFFLEVESS